MADEASKIDSNQKHCLMGVTNAATPELRNLKVDPTTGRLLVSATVSGGSGATTALDNLASVAINTDLISDTDETDDLGSSAKK